MPTQNDKYIKQIQSSLRKKKDSNGKTFKTVSYSSIRETISTEFERVDPENMTDDEKKQIVNFIHQERLKQRQQLTSAPPAASTANVSSPVTTNTDTNDTETAHPEQQQKPQTHTTNETQETAAITVTDKQPLTTSQQTDIAVQETGISTEMLAPQEAVALIQEIASDSTSRYKLMAADLLKQLDNRTDSIVKIVEAAPEIEAEMLRRKLKTATRKSVDYDSIVTEHFRQSSDEIKEYLSNIASEYNIAI